MRLSNSQGPSESKDLLRVGRTLLHFLIDSGQGFGTLRMWIPTVNEKVEGCLLSTLTLFSGFRASISMEVVERTPVSDVFPGPKLRKIRTFAV